MRGRRWRAALAVAAAALLAAGVWLGWRWYAAPAPPEVALGGASKEVAALVEGARGEVRRQPRSAAAWGKLGMVLAANDYGEAAITCFAEAERLDGGDARWPYLRGVRLMAADSRQGVPLLRRALGRAAAPEARAAILFRLALALIRYDELEEADTLLASLAEIDPDGPRVHFGLGLLAAAKDDRPAARAHLATLTETPFARKQACAILARVAQDDSDLARDCERRAARLPPDVPWPDAIAAEMQQYAVGQTRRLREATELQQQGRVADALPLLRQLAAESPGPAVYASLGTTLFQMKQWEEAAEALRTAISYDPRNVQAQYFLGAALLMRGDARARDPAGREAAGELFAQAVAAEDRALALKADHGYAHLARGEALRRLGRREEAVAALRQAVLCQPEFADVHLALGEALAEAGQTGEAVAHLEDAARLAAPDDSRPRQALDRWRPAPGGGPPDTRPRP